MLIMLRINELLKVLPARKNLILITEIEKELMYSSKRAVTPQNYLLL